MSSLDNGRGAGTKKKRGVMLDVKTMRRSARAGLVGLVVAAGIGLAGCSQQQLATTGEVLALSPQQAQQMGTETWQRILAERGRSDDRQAQARVEQLSRRLLSANGIDPAGWEIAVLKGEEVNAFALPGGKIGVYEGMVKLAETDAQLATVIGHEIGHVSERHGAQRVGLAQTAGLGLQAVSAALDAGQIAYANQIASLLGAGVQYGLVLPYSRGQELEADNVGLTYMARAGYDPSAAVGFWQRMAQTGGASPPAFLSTHPSNQQRIDGIRQRLPAAQALYRQAQ